jgi:hypothetical protein
VPITLQDYEKQTFPAELTTIHCGCCGGIYAINERYRQLKYERGEGWHCPYCKAQWGYFSNGENAMLKKQIEERDRIIARKNACLDQANAEIRDKTRQVIAQKSAKTRIKNRIANGICPCCKRHFANLERHMKNQHGDYANREE